MMDANTWILLALTVAALIVAYARRPGLAGEGTAYDGRLLRGVARQTFLRGERTGGEPHGALLTRPL